MSEAYDRMMRALNKLAKWRTVFTGWHLGTRATNDPGVQAMRDLREAVMMHRVELNALVGLLSEKGILTADEWADALGKEAVMYDADIAKLFPGYRTFAGGVEIYDVALARETHIRLGFPD